MVEKILNILRKFIPKKLFRMLQPAYHFALALTGNLFYRFPGRKLRIIGVTGTNGKSTTVELINSILKEAGFKTGMISTVAIEIAGDRKDNLTNRTTLGRWQNPRLLRKMIKKGCDYAILEVASEGIAWFRVWGIPFDVAVFTNLSPEHLNFHKTMASYRNTKGKLFLNLSLSKKKKLRNKQSQKKEVIKKISVVNADDRESPYFGAFPADGHYFYGIKKGDIRAKNINSRKELEFDILYEGKSYHVKSPLFASFNVYNILAAWAVGISQNVTPDIIEKGIAKVKKVAGRMDHMAQKNGVNYFLDYAVTPDAFELLFSELRKLTKGRLISVFGATGDRDRQKRPRLGEVAAKMCDLVIITDEEPYNEDPQKIIDEVASGAERIAKDKVIKISDRLLAIKKAIRLAKSGDTVVITGMGHQKYRNIGGTKKIPWDEAAILKRLLGK